MPWLTSEPHLNVELSPPPLISVKGSYVSLVTQESKDAVADDRGAAKVLENGPGDLLGFPVQLVCVDAALNVLR